MNKIKTLRIIKKCRLSLKAAKFFFAPVCELSKCGTGHCNEYCQGISFIIICEYIVLKTILHDTT